MLRQKDISKKKSSLTTAFDSPTLITSDQNIYAALRARGLLLEPNDGSGIGHLVKEGELGLSSDNGKAQFLAPGRHVLWSPLHTFKGTVSISNKNIQLNNITIVTIDNSQIGLSKRLGQDILLEPGQHILEAPQNYIESKNIDTNYVKLGAHHWITVPVGYVAIANNHGKKIIITPIDIKVDSDHEQYITYTDGEIFKINSPTFRFDEYTGFKSTQLEDIQLEKLTVNTKEFIPLNVVGSVRYQIVDPVRAFLITDDVEGDIRKQAQATLTSVFAKLSIDDIASSIASTNISHKKTGNSEIPHDMLHEATDMFMDEFKSVAKMWGVEATLINITSLELMDDKFRETVKARAQQRMDAATQRMIVETQTEAELKKADREKQIKTIQADANADVIKKIADAELYAAERKTQAARQLAAEPLAANLAVLDKQIEIAGKLGDKTVITDMPLMRYGTYSKNNLLFFDKNNGNEKPGKDNAVTNELESVSILRNDSNSFIK